MASLEGGITKNYCRSLRAWVRLLTHRQVLQIPTYGWVGRGVGLNMQNLTR